MDNREIEKRLHFLLGRRNISQRKSTPQKYSKVLVVERHMIVMYEDELFIGKKCFGNGFIYLHRDHDKVVATRENEIVVFDFCDCVIERIKTGTRVLRCEVQGEYFGVLFHDELLKVFKNKRCVISRGGISEFSLPDAFVGSDGDFSGYKNVRKLFKCQDSGRLVVVCDELLMCDGNDIVNPFMKGDIDYVGEVRKHYYFCSFNGVMLLASSSSSEFLLLGRNFQELELEEEMKLLRLRVDEKFNLKYLTGMDYSGGTIYLLDEDGVVSEFDVCGISKKEDHSEREVVFKEERFFVLENDLITLERVSLDVAGEGSPKGAEREPWLSSLCELFEVASGHDGEVFEEREDEIGFQKEKSMTGNEKIDTLLEDIIQQTDGIIDDIRGIEVEKAVFQMYKYNTNDLAFLIEQTYRNIMRLERYKEMKEEMVAQLTFMLGSLDTYRKMNEDHIKSTVKYIDTVIGRVSCGRRHVVHYTRPLFYDIRRTKHIGVCLDNVVVEIEKTLGNVHDAESVLLRESLDDISSLKVKEEHSVVNKPIKDSVDASSTEDKKDYGADMFNRSGRQASAPLANSEISQIVDVERSGDNNYESNFYSMSENLSLRNSVFPNVDASSVSSQHTNIFGQTVPEQEQVQFGNMFLNLTSSNIFQSVASGYSHVAHSDPSRKEEIENDIAESTPNALSRFASDRNLFK